MIAPGPQVTDLGEVFFAESARNGPDAGLLATVLVGLASVGVAFLGSLVLPRRADAETSPASLTALAASGAPVPAAVTAPAAAEVKAGAA